jgi:hypothetical protein
VAGFALARATWRSGARRLALAVLAVAALDVVLIVATEEAGTAYSGLLQRLFALGSLGLPVLAAATLSPPGARPSTGRS